MEQYRTEEEQVEALRRWWDENGRSTVVAIIIALAAGFGWQNWKSGQERQAENASDVYQAMLQAVGQGASSAEQRQAGMGLAEQLKSAYGGSTYAQFAALHLAAMAVANNDLPGAEQELRWVLAKADKGSDTASVAQLRLARVLASSGDTGQALAILEQQGKSSYQASYAVARGDILLSLGRDNEAREAYTLALMQAAGDGGQVSMPALRQKLQSLSPVPPRTLEQPETPASDSIDAVQADAVNDQEG